MINSKQKKKTNTDLAVGESHPYFQGGLQSYDQNLVKEKNIQKPYKQSGETAEEVDALCLCLPL